MDGNSKSIKRFLPLVLLWGMYACTPYFHQPMGPQKARLGAETQTKKELASLPGPKEKIVAAVYNFRDQTGQYKLVENGTSWSTAVTQGATSILLKALEESGWFIIIEREGLSNLLNERKIIRSSRANFDQQGTANQQLLPPLLFAGIVLEGGIISYDSNILTGGAGMRYFGAGGSGQYRQDIVSVYLRAISTGNGRILKTVYTTKTILSQKVDVGVFRFVKFKRLLEAETGFTYNEPTELALKEAIEKAVQSLIIEGVQDGLWTVNREEDLAGEVFTRYMEEKEQNDKLDLVGSFFLDNPYKHSAGINAALNRYAGDYTGPLLTPGGEVNVTFWENKRISLQCNGGGGKLASREYYASLFVFGEGVTQIKFFPAHVHTPYILGGAGYLYQEKARESKASIKQYHLPYVTFGLGYKYHLNTRWSLNVKVDNRYFLTDKLDDQVRGKYHDFFWNANIGVTYHFNMQFGKKKTKESF